MTTRPHFDRWSLQHAFQAARTVRRAEFGRQAIATVRPRGVVGFARRRAPLAVMLYLASWEGRLVCQDLDGFAMLEPPVRAGRGWAAGRRGPWLLRLLDRRFDTVLLTTPVIASLLTTAVAASAGAGPVAAVAALAGGAYLVALAAARAAASLGFLAGYTELGQLGAVGRSDRLTGGRPADHWSLSLCHQTRPERADDLLRMVADQLGRLVHAQVARAAVHGGRVPADAVETLVCLTGGITTSDVRSLVATSAMAVAPDPDDGDVVVLLAPTYPVPAGHLDPTRHPRPRGAAFFAWYLCGLVVVSLANARYVAVHSQVSYDEAVRWLASRLLFSDTLFTTGVPGGSAGVPGGHGGWGPATLGWLTSFAGLVTAAVGLVAARQYLTGRHQLREDSDAAMTDVITRSRVLILVVTAHERDSVIDAVVARTGRGPVASTDGDRTIFALGKVGGADLMLAQAGESGTSSDAGMGAVARAAIRLCRPDYVVLVGTCYGLRPDDDEQRIGDILVSQRVETLDRPRVTDRLGGTRVLSRGVDLGPSPILLERCRSAQRSWSRHRARIHFGLILSSTPGSEHSIGDQRKHHPDAVGGESESSGVYEAATRHRLHWVMVKSISDWGAGRSEEFEDIAARNAADFATHMVAIGSLPQP